MSKGKGKTVVPAVHLGEEISISKHPFLGSSRVNKVIAVINGLLRMRIVRGPVDKVTFTPKGGFVLQIASTTSETEVAASSSGFHPFKIYQLPSELRTVTDASDWRKVRVRSGRIGAVTESNVSGSDELEHPDSDEYPEGDFDITVPAATSKYYLWLKIDGLSATIEHGTSPATADGGAWESYPDPDGVYMLIGWVDTQTHAAESRVLIRQLLRTDVFQMSAGTGGAVWQ